MRLNRFLAAAGIGSRRHCDELIAAGRVTINGKTCTDFSAQPSGGDHVKVNGKLIHVAPPLTTRLSDRRYGGGDVWMPPEAAIESLIAVTTRVLPVPVWLVIW